MSSYRRALVALATAASRIPEGVSPPPDRYDALCAALAQAWQLLSPDEQAAAIDDPAAALAELLGEHEAAEGVYRRAVAGLIGRECAAWR